MLESFSMVDFALKHRPSKPELPGASDDMRSRSAILLAQKHGIVTNTDVAAWNDLRDGGDGSLERLIVVALAMVTVVFAVLARLEWRRMQPAYG